MGDVACCFVCGTVVAHPLPRCGIVLCPEHHTTIARTLQVPAEWLDLMLTAGLRDHHSDVDLSPALRVYAQPCEFCGCAWYHCEAQPTGCCDECTHPNGEKKT